MTVTPTDTKIAYALGQLAAVLARANAFRSESRALEIAAITPARIIQPALTDALRAGLSSTLKARIEEIMATIPAMPTRALVSEEQGLFHLGYYHERGRLRGGRPPKPESEAVNTARLEILLPPDLKEWTMRRGGATLVRRLLETARNAEATTDVSAAQLYGL